MIVSIWHKILQNFTFFLVEISPYLEDFFMDVCWWKSPFEMLLQDTRTVRFETKNGLNFSQMLYILWHSCKNLPKYQNTSKNSPNLICFTYEYDILPQSWRHCSYHNITDYRCNKSSKHNWLTYRKHSITFAGRHLLFI